MLSPRPSPHHSDCAMQRPGVPAASPGLTFASASVDHTQGRVSALGSLVLTHGLVGPAVGCADGFGLSPGAVEVALRVTVAYEKLD